MRKTGKIITHSLTSELIGSQILCSLATVKGLVKWPILIGHDMTLSNERHPNFYKYPSLLLSFTSPSHFFCFFFKFFFSLLFCLFLIISCVNGHIVCRRLDITISLVFFNDDDWDCYTNQRETFCGRIENYD
jgi:hypothetical protein